MLAFIKRLSASFCVLLLMVAAQIYHSPLSFYKPLIIYTKPPFCPIKTHYRKFFILTFPHVFCFILTASPVSCKASGTHLSHIHERAFLFCFTKHRLRRNP